MQFNIMGPFEVITDGGHTYAPKAPKICQLLAVLALQPRETVAADTLIRELWGETPSDRAPRTLQTHVYHARRLLASTQVSSSGRPLLLTKSPGYQLDLSDDEVDARVFERLVRRAQHKLDHDEVEAASGCVTRALQLWRGRPLSNVPMGSVLTGRVARVEELKIRALELRVETEHRLGRHREFLPDLRALVSEYPLHEWFHGQLIWALHHSGRRRDALEAYQNLYRILKTELGLEPSVDIQQIQAEIFRPPARGVARQPQEQDGGWVKPPVTPLWAAAFAG
ncbi:AfsR/SARP family transcriptional regulator [Streptomyces sp. NPDC050619]|uniref:AfsR/SARP family transcriptional regulator n=1 Tax=Streptomyces sp. NPDC050619 TaxID=3157214 RepID=UPI00344061E5